LLIESSWRWSLWEILWAAAPLYILWIICLPETSTDTILLHRARRLRKVTGANVYSQSEIDQTGLSARTIAVNAFVKPFEIMIKDPAIMFTNVYTALIYGIYFSFFEAFPFIYGPIYGFNEGETGLVFISNFVGCIIGLVTYFAYLHFLLIPNIKKHGSRSPEWRLRPALPCVFLFTACLFAFGKLSTFLSTPPMSYTTCSCSIRNIGWTVRKEVHWIVSVICLTIYATSNYILLQCIFVYVPMSYPQYAASIFAGNDFVRSAFAFAAVLFAPPMYKNLGIGQGISLLAGLSVMGIAGMWELFLYGHRLRARSKFAIG
jgi:MFS transporter, DHA1 family, multidrug resistance protein